MRRNLNEVVTVAGSVEQHTRVNTGTNDSDAVDTKLYDSMLFVWTVDVFTTSIQFDVCSGDASTFTPDLTATTGNKISGAGTGDVGAVGQYYAHINVSGSNRYIKVRATSGGDCYYGMTAFGYNKENVPSSLTTAFDVTDASVVA